MQCPKCYGEMEMETDETVRVERCKDYHGLYFDQLDQRLTEDPVHIRFELCPLCHSTFLDAGEFRQYVSAEYIETFKNLLPGE